MKKRGELIMSDYVKAKVIRLPFPQDLIKKLEVEDCWDCEYYLMEKLGDLWQDYKTNNGFQIECTDKAYYLDYVMEYTYGANSGSFGYAFLLDEVDKVKYVPLFNKIGIDYDVNDLRKVVYCYYNSCECADYYDISEPSFDKL